LDHAQKLLFQQPARLNADRAPQLKAIVMRCPLLRHQC
jgi:hypothetical protein